MSVQNTHETIALIERSLVAMTTVISCEREWQCGGRQEGSGLDEEGNNAVITMRRDNRGI